MLTCSQFHQFSAHFFQELHLSRVPRVPAAEVLQLLREVPPSLRSRYCARLRLEAQRRRAAHAERAERERGAGGAADGGQRGLGELQGLGLMSR